MPNNHSEAMIWYFSWHLIQTKVLKLLRINNFAKLKILRNTISESPEIKQGGDMVFFTLLTPIQNPKAIADSSLRKTQNPQKYHI
ncbi:hypothetical protein DYD21_06560 [Rhodohalobacter sp. SW132]|nr:hypothetical protein DYD21_06560 [Rhodohalobacter sp. SW132]